ncbi:ABC transporter substrate-binding protein [Pseudonocardia sp. GCM10023141]|uniref:ABC transporter substrate-binding protein n=1 Tax=Pseudonocardia sp. GCM10023141 TaxID=3252653 RepID=UPI00361E98E6
MSDHRRFAVRELWAALAAGAVLLAGCSSATEAPASPAATSSAPVERTSYPYTLTQPDGTTVSIPKAPSRIVVIDQPGITLDYPMALGVVPIGGELNTAESGFAAGELDPRGITIWNADKIKDFTSIGVPFKPDLDKLAALKPDLIVGYGGAGTDKLAQLEAIAPVFSIPSGTAPADSVQGIARLSWYTPVAELAKVLDRQAEFTAFVATFEAAAAAARSKLQGKSVSYVVPYTDLSGLQVHGAKYYGGVTLSYLGLTVAPIPPGGQIYKDSNNDGEALSIEHAGDIKGDWLVMATFGPGVSAKFLDLPLVKQLPSVKAGHVVDTSTNTPFYGFPSVGPIGQLLAIPKLATALGG